MTAGTYHEWSHSDLTRAHWLPPCGRGNGFDAPAWAPIADVPDELVDHLLAVLATADVPAYAGRVRLRSAAEPWRVWVGSLRYATAEDVLRHALPRGAR